MYFYNKYCTVFWNTTAHPQNQSIMNMRFSLGAIGAILGDTVNLLEFRGGFHSPRPIIPNHDRHNKTKVISGKSRKIADAGEPTETIEVGGESELPNQNYVLTNYGETVPQGFSENTIPYFPTLVNTRYAEKIWNHQKRKNRLMRARESKSRGSKKCRYSARQKEKGTGLKTFKNRRWNRITGKREPWKGFYFIKGSKVTKIYS